MPADVRVFDSAGELFQAAAGEFSARLQNAVRARGRFCVALSGGNTPKGLYSLLAGSYASLPWDKVMFFWSDERHVPPEHPESNFHMANETLLSKIKAPSQNVFRVLSEESNADVAASKYEQTIKECFGLAPGEIPRFDLILLGMGADGHTASLFPGSQALQEKERLVVANWVEKFNTTRITFTYPLLDRARCDAFLLIGKDKAPALRAVLEDAGSPLPAAGVRPANGDLIWLADRAAAGGLRKSA